MFDHIGLNSDKGNLTASTIELSVQRVNLTERKISPQMKIFSFQRLLRASKKLDLLHDRLKVMIVFVLIHKLILKSKTLMTSYR